MPWGNRLAAVALTPVGASGPAYIMILQTSTTGEIASEVVATDGGREYPVTNLAREIVRGQWTRVAIDLDLSSFTWAMSFDGLAAYPTTPMASRPGGPFNVEVSLGIRRAVGPYPRLSYHFDNVAIDLD